MQRIVMVVGSGRIGSLLANLLASSGDYKVYLCDNYFPPFDGSYLSIAHPLVNSNKVDITDSVNSKAYIEQNGIEAIISCVPYFLNIHAAKLAHATNIHYFDLTEDVRITHQVHVLAKDIKKAFVPQCGLAPGFINIVAHHYMRRFEKLVAAKLRVGALPINSNNALQYALNWSPEGLINEYANPCVAIDNGKIALSSPLEGVEHVQIDGLLYEAFNTSGGIGSLAETYEGKINLLNYKTLRYPGHCEKIKFLMNDLNLRNDKETLLKILKQCLPASYQDVVLMYVSVSGYQQEKYLEENYVRKIYPQTIAGKLWSAIQVTTAASTCACIDIVFEQPENHMGFVPHAHFDLNEVINNRFGKYFQ